MDIIEWQDFERVELRVGTILGAAPNPKARKPAYILEVDLGPLGLRTSSAQLTAHYQCRGTGRPSGSLRLQLRSEADRRGALGGPGHRGLR